MAQAAATHLPLTETCSKTLNLSELNPSSREDGKSSKDVSDMVATYAYGPVLGTGLVKGCSHS